MRVQVSGRHVDVGEALRSRIAEELAAHVGRFFERGGDAEVTVSRDRAGFRVDCALTLASGHQLLAHGLGPDAHAAFDQALAKTGARLRRYKTRLKSHSQAASAKAVETASLMVIRGEPQGESDDDWHDATPHAPPAAMVIAETQAPLKTMTVSMAVLDLDLTDSQAIVFRNVAHGGLSVVYRRSDGNIGWVDPARTKPSA